MYVNKIVKYIAEYFVELGGCDALVFTAGVGENSISTKKTNNRKTILLRN